MKNNPLNQLIELSTDQARARALLATLEQTAPGDKLAQFKQALVKNGLVSADLAEKVTSRSYNVKALHLME